MRITCVQFEPQCGRVEENLRRLPGLLPKSCGDLIVLPELFNTGYLLESREVCQSLAEAVPSGPTCGLLRDLAQKNQACIVAGLAEKSSGQIFNSAVVVRPDGNISTYRKRSQSRVDRQLFDRGHGQLVVEVAGVRLGFLICFDLWFGDLIQDYVAAQVDLFVHIAAFGGPQTLTMSRARAIESNTPVLTCNRVGTEQGPDFNATYRGRSQLIDGQGERLWRAGVKEEVANIDVDFETKIERTLLGVPLTEETAAVHLSRQKTNVRGQGTASEAPVPPTSSPFHAPQRKDASK